jgi:poly(3-hydroxybutyrate) depolymerase
MRSPHPRSLLLAASCVVAALAVGSPAAARTSARTLTFSYRSHSGALRTAYVVLPSWYGRWRHPPIPLVISPHGRGVSGRYNLRFWGDLPARGPFVLISPDGQGRRLPFYSWGYRGQIDDLERMPALARTALPWLTFDPRRVYAIGDSMGGQEVLLLLARRGLRLAGAAAFDPVTSMAARYRKWPVTPGEQQLPARARVEFGGTPVEAPGAYADRSPAAKVSAIARSGVPLQIWWSRRDSVITDQEQETGAFSARVRALAPTAPMQEIVGFWEHAHEMHPGTQLPAALACFGLLSPNGIRVPAYARQADGAVRQAPPESGLAAVPFSRSFCGRA